MSRRVYFHKVPCSSSEIRKYRATADMGSVLFELTEYLVTGEATLKVAMPSVDYEDRFDFSSVTQAKRFASVHFG